MQRAKNTVACTLLKYVPLQLTKETRMWSFRITNHFRWSRPKPPRGISEADSIEQRVAYSSLLASGVAGVDEVSFEEFAECYHRAKKLPG